MTKKVSSQVLVSILGFLKPFTTKTTLSDIKTLFQPCCKPTLSILEEYACEGGTSNTVFVSATVTFPEAANKDVTLIFRFTDTDNNNGIGSSSIHTTLDSNGSWTDTVSLNDYFVDGVSTVTVSLLVDGHSVVTTSDPISLTGIPNCD